MPLPPQHDIIAAIATPPGKGGIGVVRISGPGAFEVAGALWKGPALNARRAGRFGFGQLVDQGGMVLDEGLALVFRAPHSYTGQDTVELQVHGSPVVLRAVLEATFRTGARPAEPGEFTLRAYLNGRMDLSQAEAVLQLVEAESDAARKNALYGLSGRLSSKIDEIKNSLLELLAHVQATLDYPEEGVEPHRAETIIGEALAGIEVLLETESRGRIATEGAKLVLIGTPNAGKSSLMNALLGFERAIVTPIPGTTRDYLEGRLELAGIPLVAMDTAGLRETGDPIEAAAVQRAKQLAEAADLVLYLADLSRPQPAPPQLRNSSVINVAAKADLDHLWYDPDFLPVSSRTGEGLATLREQIAGKLLGGDPRAGAELWIGNQRHAAALREAKTHLQESRGAPDDLMGLSVQAALDALSGITGQIISEEVVLRIFSNFCVGK